MRWREPQPHSSYESGGISTPTHKKHFSSQGDVTLHKPHFARIYNTTKGLVVDPNIVRVHGTTNKDNPHSLSIRFGWIHTYKNESRVSCSKHFAKRDPDSGMACDFNNIIHEIQILNSTAPRGSSKVEHQSSW